MSQDRWYVDILLNEPHCLAKQLMTQVMSNLHRLLRHHEIRTVGVTFPEYGSLSDCGEPSLGQRVRLVSMAKGDLFKLINNVTFKTLDDLGVISIADVSLVPENAQEVRFRKENKTYREMARKKGESATRLRYADIEKSSVAVIIKRTTGVGYPIFVECLDAYDRVDGSYSSYGLTNLQGSTMPWF